MHTSLRPVHNTFLQTMIGSARILRPLEAAAAAALPPKFEEAAAAVADATSLPYSCDWQRQLQQHLMSQIHVICLQQNSKNFN